MWIVLLLKQRCQKFCFFERVWPVENEAWNSNESHHGIIPLWNPQLWSLFCCFASHLLQVVLIIAAKTTVVMALLTARCRTIVVLRGLIPSSLRSFATGCPQQNIIAQRVNCQSSVDIEAFGDAIAKQCRPGAVLLLKGDMGAGKTCFGEEKSGWINSEMDNS